jgi:hypothetical protein
MSFIAPLVLQSNSKLRGSMSGLAYAAATLSKKPQATQRRSAKWHSKCKTRSVVQGMRNSEIKKQKPRKQN